jgi:hypothetical protein
LKKTDPLIFKSCLTVWADCILFAKCPIPLSPTNFKKLGKLAIAGMTAAGAVEGDLKRKAVLRSLLFTKF